MKAVIQRVTQASVHINQQCYSKIDKGLLVLLGIDKNDDDSHAKAMAKRLLSIRCFSDEKGKMTHSIQDISGDLLIVSQFTLSAECKKGNRPSFTSAAAPEKAESLYEEVVSLCRKSAVGTVNTGSFGAMMSVTLENEGPVTFILET
ncbi:D-tyrosyl-tRNA(Tyr) deacylase [Candidatus Marinamargulisbacteria bacterium SCGC AG-439-L15]|nr:D-tyrosyl-tRNA(Tyr) deacylase [Candidatus Marinamargulisbacteria bacterium SCGC AG-439-L15]